MGVGGIRFAAWMVALGLAVGVPAQEMRIQFAEKVAIEAAAGTTEFDAYGRRFTLELESNDRLVSALAARGKLQAGNRLFRGMVRGMAGSWVRLARVGDSLEGAIWDGNELYVVTRHSSIAPNLSLALDASPAQTVVYRLSDSINGLSPEYCGVERGLPSSKVGSTSALKQYQSIVAELRANAALVPTEQLDIALIADTAFQAQYGILARDAILARMNTVEGIFSAQVGVLLAPSELRFVPSGSDPFTTNDAHALLDQLADYRSATPGVREAGLAHLFTGRQLEDNIAGVAFIDALCESHEGVSLSDTEPSQFYSALVMAHELGHNFGARHDGVPGVCETVTYGYLMWPQLNGSATFSQCSLTSMQSTIARARGVCIGAPHYADLTVQLPTSPHVVDTSAPFSLPVTVRSVGTQPVQDARVRVTWPAQLAYQSASVANGSCTVAGTVLNCTLGDLAPNEQRVIDLRLQGASLGTFTVEAEVDGDNDFRTSNNQGSVLVGLQSAIDLGVAMTVNPATSYMNDLVEFTVDVSSVRTQTVSNGRLAVHLFGIPVDSFDAGGHVCAIQTDRSVILCQLAPIAGGATSRIMVRTRPNRNGSFTAQANVNAENEGDYSNNYVNVNWLVLAEREVITRASTEDARVVIGDPFDVTYTLTAGGRLPSDDVTLEIAAPFYGDVESVIPSAGTCAVPAPGVATLCTFGSLNPADVRTVNVRVRMHSAGTSVVTATTRYMAAMASVQAAVFTWIRSNLRTDAAASLFTLDINEGQRGFANVDVQSIGIDPAGNVVATIDVPAPVRMLGVAAEYNPAGFQCSLVTSQRARCTGSFTSSPQLFRARIDYTADVAALVDLTVDITADNDGNSANDRAVFPLRVRPVIDLRVTSPTRAVRMFVGETIAIDATVATGRNPAPAARILAAVLPAIYALESIRFNGADCTITQPNQFATPGCDVGDLPANSTFPVTVRYRALATSPFGQFAISAFTNTDSDRSNDSVFVDYLIVGPTEVQLAVAQLSVTGTAGVGLRLPLVVVTNGAQAALDVVVQIPLPPFTTINSVSSTAICSGTTTLSCHFSSIPALSQGTIDVQLFTSASGTFTSNITMTALNDSSAVNNDASIAIRVTSPSPPSSGGGSSGGGGGGGGGSTDWLVLALLSLLALARAPGYKRPLCRIRDSCGLRH
jgi:hypothetical protein